MTIKPQPDCIPLSVQRHNLLYIAIDGALIGLMAAGMSFVSVWVVRLGASPFWISLLSSAPAAIALLMALPWSRFAERQRYPQRVFAFGRLMYHLVYPLLALVPFFLHDEWAARVVVILWTLSALPRSLTNMMFTIVMGQAVPPERRAFLMSRRWTFLGLAKLIAMTVAGQVLDRLPFPTGYQVIYGFNALLIAPALYCASRIRVGERVPPPPAPRLPWLARLREQLVEVWRAKAFLAFVGGRAVFGLGMTMAAVAVPIYWVHHLQVSDAWVGYFNAALSAATLMSYMPWVRIKGMLGTRRMMVAAALMRAAYPALLSLTRAPVGVLVVVALGGLAFGGLNLGFFDTLLDTSPPDRRERFVALNITAVNLTGIVGPSIGAALLGMMNIRGVLVMGTLVASLGVAILAFASGGQRGGDQSNRA